MITVLVKRAIKLPVDQSILIKAAQRTLEFTDPSNESNVSIVVGSDRLLRGLNRQYRGVDATTDVLSFPSGEVDPDSSQPYLGDVIISLPQAQRQAASENHPLADELQLLVIHGILHLQGFDHMTTADKKQMQVIQDKIIRALALNLEIDL